MVQVLGHSNTLAYEQWPSYDEALLVQDTVNLPIQAFTPSFTSICCCIKYHLRGRHHYHRPHLLPLTCY